jgi:antitoxin (DNA-binding transcriptional repressor) of toxin-antitoxin stability system
MYHMRTASVRDLRYNFPAIEQILARGEEIRITKRGKVIAKLTPPVREPSNMPDFLGRMQGIFGDRKLTPSGAQLIVQDRDRY